MKMFAVNPFKPVTRPQQADAFKAVSNPVRISPGRDEVKFSSRRRANIDHTVVAQPQGVTFQPSQGAEAFAYILQQASLGHIVSIGREADNMCIIPLETVGRKQAEIYFDQDNQLVVENLGTTNPTQIDRVNLNGTQMLKPGNIIRVGGCDIPVSTVTRQPIPTIDPEAITRLIKLEIAKGHAIQIGRYTGEANFDDVQLRLLFAPATLSRRQGMLEQDSERGYKFTAYETRHKTGYIPQIMADQECKDPTKYLEAGESMSLYPGDVLKMGDFYLRLP